MSQTFGPVLNKVFRAELLLPKLFCSLINHILMPLDSQISAMQATTDKFVMGTLNISKDRLYLQPAKGGLGLILIRDFLISQHTIWLNVVNEKSNPVLNIL